MNTLNAKDKLLLLIKCGFTERKISQETGIPQPTINRIKHGKEPRETYVRVIDSYFAQQGSLDVPLTGQLI